MIRLSSFPSSYYYRPEEIEIKEEVFSKYKYALAYIGVDFERADVQEALLESAEGMEAAFQATIVYWDYLKSRSEVLEYPNAFLIQALYEHWRPWHWQEQYLENPNFKNPCWLWWEKAQKQWGRDLRNRLIADVNEDDGGKEYILFHSGEKLSLSAAKAWGWERLEEYATHELLKVEQAQAKQRQLQARLEQYRASWEKTSDRFFN